MTEEINAFRLDMGDVFRHYRTDAGWREVIDRTQPTKYGPAVYATADPETGEYRGLFTTAPENVGGPTVERKQEDTA